MECTWDESLLRLGDQLPEELLDIIRTSRNDQQYLEILTKTALDARHTYILLAHCDNLFAHICASLRSHASVATSLATLGRIVPHAPFLAPFATQLLEREEHLVDFSNIQDHDLLLYLLGLFRLLKFNHRIFKKHVPADQLTALIGSCSPPATYLILRILQIHLSAADHWFESAVRKHLGPDSVDAGIDGVWDEKVVDYRFLTLWEEDRFEAMEKLRRDAQTSSHATSTYRTISNESFHPSTSLVGGVLLPRTGTHTVANNACKDLVCTATVGSNLSSVAQALKSSNSLLLSGLPGSGKTLLIRHVAKALGKLDKMVTLHLNEQSDAKLLLGLYTTGDTPGSFVWRPGVLTTAVQEGRWVLIEDLDRAPNEVLGTLLPLIERRELQLSNRKDVVYAAEGFRILATVRSSVNHRGEESKPLTHMLGFRHWHTIPIAMPPTAEHGSIAAHLYPSLEKLLPQFMAVYERLITFRQQATLAGQSKTGVARPISPRDLLKWCHRVAALLKSRTSFTSSEIDSIYLEAIDCFVGALPDGSTRDDLSAVIAEELHIDPQRRQYLLTTREVQYQADKYKIVIGRYSLTKSRQFKAQEGSFSTNPHTTRMLERVTAAVLNREPLLLVGETGVGKTTAVQHLANHVGKKLVPFNLSQQSEAGDLLGGFKPVNARTLMVPMKDEFDDLFAQSFSATKNQQFLQLLGKQMAKGNWKALCKLWHQALTMVEQQRAPSPAREEAPSKKRKVDSKHVIDFARWDEFAAQVHIVEGKLAGGNEIAFTFIEGNIVKAVRNGDWVLLDEINLASSDTLEAIADLLDAAPSLLLTEAGNIERINAHPDFRVFAAMNPATDVGKKDLPPGIRSRFTELYVDSPDKDLKSLQSIVRAYLRQESSADPGVALDVSQLYQDILARAADNKLVDGAGQRPHFSLRTLTRTLSFAKNIQQSCSLRRALYEGFQMSFLTFLDSESIQLVQPLILKHLFKKTNVRAELQKALRKPDDGNFYVQGHPGSKHWIRRGAAELQDQPEYIITPFVQGNLENLVRAASTRQFPVLIQGPTSSGKTSMIEYLAKRTGHTFTRINNHEHTDLQEYLGTYVSGTDGRLQFQEGVLVKALREGHWIVLDELNLAPTDVLEALNRLLDDNRELLVPETQEVIRPHSDFMLFATQNPAGLYGGRKILSRAFRNRFLELHFDDIPVDELQEILHRRTQLPESRSRRIVAVYKELSVLRQENRLFEQKSFATLRDLFRWALRPNDTIDQLAANGYMLLCERVRKPEERVALKAVIEKVMSEKGPRVRIDEEALYAETCPEISLHKQNASADGVVWTKAMRRLYVLVSRAIDNNEPVLLVGETGCGKTTVCQMLARALAKELHTVNAHQNTETGDLIGSQRPVRNRAAIEAALREQLIASEALRSVQQREGSTDALLAAYDQELAALSKEQKAYYSRSASHQAIQTSRTRFKALFEWADGSLVHAMRDGSFFLLDEISLADDSVLERINSVLESQRSILLAEKGSLDSSISAAAGFQFFATMNPGGDYGKRELSPALRNRFTEVWVPALSDMDDILQIVRVKLVPAAHDFADAMVEFASWFKSRFDTSASASVSIRDTLAWVEFINAFQQNLAAAVVHGAAMVYIDTLGANPAGLMSVISNDIEQERQACLGQLGKHLGVDAHAVYGETFDVQLDAARFGIGPFGVNRLQNAAPRDLAFTFEPPTTRSNAMRVMRALQLVKPVMLEGSPGVGKTAIVTAIAGAVGMPLTRINLSDQTDLLDLFGSDAPVEGAQTGTFVWRDAPFLRAMKKGEWVLLDEMNLASQSVLEGLNACLDHRGEVFVPELGQSFTRHPDFRLFAAQNPHHQGGGRKGLPASFVNRFTVVYADSFKAEDLMLICQRMFPNLERAYIEQAVAFVSKLNDDVANRRKFGSSGGPWEFNLRDTARWLGLAASGEGLLKAGTPQDFVDILFAQRFRTSFDRSCVQDLFATVFSDAQPMSDMFCNLSSRTLQVGIGILPRDSLVARPQASGTIQAPSHLRALQSIMLCVHQAWPVVLAGPPGVGKTSIIERLAASVGANVVTLAMSAETDALDLIGGYEQYDPHRQSAQALSLAQILPPQAQSEILPLITALRATAKTIDEARFEWIDGPLIEALQQGKWLILDNANLCSPSVLDRLNSLLEPNGTLVVNEHNGPDGTARIIRPHPNFRIFLTVDPRLGELSRAMRNRAVELHLSPNDMNVTSTDGLHTESAIARFKALSAADGELASTVASDHLAISDRILVPRLQRQIQNGLFAASSLHPDAITSVVKLDISPAMAFYEDSASAMQTTADYACVQTLHPLNNTPLVLQVASTGATRALSLAARYDAAVSLQKLIKAVSDVSADRKLMESLARFIRAARKDSGSSSKSSMTQILKSMLLPILDWTQTQLTTTEGELLYMRKAMNNLLSICWFVVQNLGTDAMDRALLATSVMVARTICSKSIVESTTLAPTLDQFQEALSELKFTSNGESGQACVALWKTFKPQMPTNMDQLSSLLKFEQVVEHFDQTVRFGMPVKEIVALRLAFQRALDIGTVSGADLDALAEKAMASIPQQKMEVDGESSEDAVTLAPHFAAAFGYLCQHFALLTLSKPRLTPAESTALEVLALRKTMDGMNRTHGQAHSSPQRLLSVLGLCAQSEDEAGHDDGQNGDQIISVALRRISDADMVSLHGLNLLESETKALGQTVASKADLVSQDGLPALDTCLRHLVHNVLESISAATGALSDESARLIAALDGQEHTSGYSNSALLQLWRVIQYLLAAKSPRATNAQSSSDAWSAFAVACFELYIPDHAFDPVQEAQIQTAVFQQTKDDVQSRLVALRAFRQAWVGEQDSLRARLLEQDLNVLGEGPPAVQICRPPTSELAQLHSEFQALMRIVKPLRQKANSHQLNSDWVTQPLSEKSDIDTLDQNAWSNLRVIRIRLTEQYRAYGDLTVPVVGFIDALFIARRLGLRGANLYAAKSTVRRSVTTITPIVDAGLKDWLSDDHFIRVQQACRSKDEQLYWLSVIAVRSCYIPVKAMSADLRNTIDVAFRGFYEAWRTELSRDQRLDAANSSLYRYRGGDDDEEETSAEELNELFPGYENGVDAAARSTKSKIGSGAQALAANMARLYHSVHSPLEANHEHLIELIQQIGRLSVVAPQMTMPGLLCSLHQLITKLSSATPTSRSRFANIYLEPNLGQCKALVALISKIQARFEFIHSAWPEHASPIEVQRACNTVLELSHSEPLACFLPPVEKLHAAIAEWQKVASSEYSASALLEDITSMVISWRQLELSTWAGLFEHEDRECQKSAASWWYIAYETIIRASDEISRSTESLAMFAQDLIETLGTFLANCGMGEYSIRLSMLRDFEADLATRSTDHPMLVIVREALASLVAFYSHFEGTVKEHLAKRRAELEKEVKNVIQLASWKDRNIEKLRDSAKSSHKKLFKSVRKYRRLLSEPVKPLLMSDLPRSAAGDMALSMYPQHLQRSAEDVDSPQSVTLQSWLERPDFIIDLSSTIHELERHSQANKLPDAARKIAKFLSELDDESNELRKATPSVATEENKKTVQHLKTRKRRLLADVLRDVRLMGFQTNISDDVLAQQSSLHVVLAKVPPLTLYGGQIMAITAADQDFHRLLHIMPSVRESTVKHSEDLTPAEVARGRTLLESMLQFLVSQHTALGEHIGDCTKLQTVLSQLTAVARSQEPSARDHTAGTVNHLRAKISSLRSVLDACIQCVQIQSELSGPLYDASRSALQTPSNELAFVDVALQSQGTLPAGVDNAAIRAVEESCALAVQQISHVVAEQTGLHPELGPVLGQLSRWVQSDDQKADNATSRSITTSDRIVKDLLAILHQVKSIAVTVEPISTNGTAKKAWLLEQQSLIHRAMQALQVGPIAMQLASLFGTMQHISDSEMPQISLVCSEIFALFQAYARNVEQTLEKLCKLHAASAQMAHRLATSFIQLAQHGFCTPSEKEPGDDKHSGQVESGTGLGDGEGGEDISKDVGADEDLSELAQDAKSKDNDDDDEMENEKDAVDMADEDLEGDFDEDAGSEGEEDEEKDMDDADIDEEAGSVDEKDGAVDEKTWDDGKAEDADKEADKGKGTRTEDVAAAENAEAGEEEGKQGQEGEDGEQDEETGADDEAEAEHMQPEQADPHMEQEQNLDLPEDINMDGDKDDDISDAGSEFADELSDVDFKGEAGQDEPADTEMEEKEGEQDAEDGEDNGEATTEDQEPIDDGQEEDAGSDVAMLDQPEAKDDPNDGLVSADAGQGNEDDETAQNQGALSAAEQFEEDHDAQQQPSTQSGAAEGSNKSQQEASSGKAEPGQQEQDLPYKQLGDVLKQWYEQHREIEAAQEPKDDDAEPGAPEDVDMTDPRFEHLPENGDSDMQALGAAAVEQSKALDEQNAMPIEETEPEDTSVSKLEESPQPPQDEPKDSEAEGTTSNDKGGDSAPKQEKAIVGQPKDLDMDLDMAETAEDHEEGDLEEVDEQLTNTHLSQDGQGLMTIEEARQAWSEHESRTRNMAIVLTEHLRLILQPTQATKMRGDFRTGKRLNIKKIIPYIASSYKRDKIWMRRSIPSKRSYQIMLAIDNSESMNENERKGLAFDTLALVAKSMSMLEVGELCIVGFGETININHEFDMPFTSDAGAEVFRQFSFSQSKTDVKKLLEKSIELFRTARLKATGATSNLWQLQLIISDGLCEDHPSVRQLVRQAHEEQIMVVFIVVDSAAEESSVGPQKSIIDLPVAQFAKDANGDMQVKMGKYLDTFPFRYYLIVRDVLELPSVLAGALRQWFAEVVEAGG
ncbi:unnamed protein product [Zymoseptoria tritici ST99CH_3D7]|uniref:Midasin n=1 Tax=Zymoseptoria tritici (strain ST99CH_3D7) TaxID=1276538 RepID=A0A1X7RNH8_ZYMT9|nr:unnamed protein product [Zymoseptoria tritici ST99CH_3D7]